ncbi:hypothetical protein U1Q18_048940, partial [Sarracenia purpurea var. burkii]
SSGEERGAIEGLGNELVVVAADRQIEDWAVFDLRKKVKNYKGMERGLENEKNLVIGNVRNVKNSEMENVQKVENLMRKDVQNLENLEISVREILENLENVNLLEIENLKNWRKGNVQRWETAEKENVVRNWLEKEAEEKTKIQKNEAN